MSQVWGRRAFVLAAMLASAALAWGQQRQIKEGERYVDKRCDFEIDEPKGWYLVATQKSEMDAEMRRLWVEDQLTAIVIFTQDMKEAVLPSTLELRLLATKEGKPVDFVKVGPRQLYEIAGMKAGWIEAEGRGVGINLVKEGSVQTKQVWVAIPRGNQMVTFVLSTSEANYSRASEVFKRMLKSLKMGGKQTKEQAAVSAKKLDDQAPDEFDQTAQQELARADALRASGRLADALALYDEIGIKFAARDAGKLANQRARDMRDDPEVMKAIEKAKTDKNEQAADKQGEQWLKTARQMAAAKNYDLARKYYQKIIDKYPGTTVATTAAEELKKLPQTP